MTTNNETKTENEMQIVRCHTGESLHRSFAGKSTTFCGRKKAFVLNSYRGSSGARALCRSCYPASGRKVAAAIVEGFSPFASEQS